MRIVFLTSAARGHHWKSGLIDAARAAGHEVTSLLANSRTDRIAAACRDADALVWLRTHGLAPAGDADGLLRTLRHRGGCTVGVHPDAYWGLPGRDGEIGRHPFFRCAVVFTGDDPRHPWGRRGVCQRWMPPMFNPRSVLEGRYRREYTHEVAFIGGGARYAHRRVWPHRPQLVAWLAAEYGSGFRHHWRTFGQNFADVCMSTRLVVSDACAPLGSHIISDRPHRVLAHYGTVVHTRLPFVTDGTLYTEGQHMACWTAGDWGELRAVIDDLLCDDRQRETLSRQGREHALRYHTCAARWGQIEREIVR